MSEAQRTVVPKIFVILQHQNRIPVTQRSLTSQKFEKKGFLVVADFICPNPETRKLFNSDFIIWMDTIKTSKFKDTNSMFVKPKKFNVRIKVMSLDFRKKESLRIARKIKRIFKLG